MTKAELLEILIHWRDLDPEIGHQKADEALLEYINDAEISEAYKKIGKWYA